MMPKVVLKAPPGVGGQIHASATQKNYTIDGDGLVTVDAADARDLIGAGFYVLPHDGTPDTPTAAPITSDSLTSDTQGAQAIDPKARDLGRRPADPNQGSPTSKDFGAAKPPHGLPADTLDPTLAKHKEADAELERQTAELSGKKDLTASEQPNTGSLPNPSASAQDQQQAAVGGQDQVQDVRREAPPDKDHQRSV